MKTARIAGVLVTFTSLTNIVANGKIEQMQAALPLVRAWGARVYLDIDAMEIRRANERHPEKFTVLATYRRNSDGDAPGWYAPLPA